MPTIPEMAKKLRSRLGPTRFWQDVELTDAVLEGVRLWQALTGQITFTCSTANQAHEQNKFPNYRLEVFWTAVPPITVLGFAYLGSWSLSETTRADPKPLEVTVIGSQWSWRFEYPALGIVSNELRLPENKQALLHLWSTDVIHSFWVPEFRVKQDALPSEEMTRDLRVTPTLVGTYAVRCAELCGLRHTYMEAPVRVLTKDDFDKWVAQEPEFQTIPSNAAKNGTPHMAAMPATQSMEHPASDLPGRGRTEKWKTLPMGRQ